MLKMRQNQFLELEARVVVSFNFQRLEAMSTRGPQRTLRSREKLFPITLDHDYMGEFCEDSLGSKLMMFLHACYT